MLLPPSDLDLSDLRRMLADQYGTDAEPRFVPLGEDSWCYRAGGLWVSLRRDLRGHHPAAYAAAHSLARSGCDFVLAPLAGRDGRIAHDVGGIPALVFPYVVAEPLDAATASPRTIADAITLMGRVHAAGSEVALSREDYRLDFEQDIDTTVDCGSGGVRETGPYTVRLVGLVKRHLHTISGLRTELADLAAACAASEDPMVLTHGEPRAQNILVAENGLLFADWGDAMWGPPERDWFHFLETLGQAPPCRPDFLRFYQVRWILSEIAEYGTHFLAPHDGDEEDAAMWDRLTAFIPE
ncbi:spectinomycin phosphotransferase [Catenulispora sp. GP43]|uniref:phosphotransferase n=1 Tax=Catenulispora sp. GP43 TaxID=3156263 RepID=UPI0035113D3B